MRKYIAFAQLPEWQRVVGARVRTARKRAKLSQTKLGNAIGLTRDQLNNVELGRVALRFRPGWNLCLLLDLNPEWLATGNSAQYGCVDLSGMEDQPRDDEPFTDVLDDVISDDPYSGWPGYAKYREQHLDSLHQRETLLNEGISIADWLKQVRPELHAEFLMVIHQAARNFIRGQYEDVNRRLTSVTGFGEIGSMKLQKMSFWPVLRERIQKLVRQRGMKSVLARDIGVTRQAVNALLSKKYVPSGEQALKLSKWVEIAEAQQEKCADRQQARPLRQTRRGKSAP